MDTIRKHCAGGEGISLMALGSHIGIRDTRRIKCQYQLSAEDVLYGRRFDDAIGNSAYPIDIHYDDRPGAAYRYLDGVEEYDNYGHPGYETRWRTDSGPYPTFWQIPFRSLIPQGEHENLLVCGRGIDADRGAFGATRVMTNCNQTGEAAGIACAIALKAGKGLDRISPEVLRKELAAGGSIVL
jgi:hypothetical protein